MQCFMCFGSDSKLQMIQTDLDNDTIKRIKFVLPNFLIPESKEPVFICSTCLEQISFFYTVRKASLQNCSRLKHFNALLKGTDNFKCNDLSVIINSREGSAQCKHQIEYKINPKSKYLLSSDEHDATRIKEEDIEDYSQQLVNNEGSLNHLRGDKSSSNSDDSTQHHVNVGSFEFVDTNKFAEKDERDAKHIKEEDKEYDHYSQPQQLVNYLQDDESSFSTIKHVDKVTKNDLNLTSTNNGHEEQPKTQRGSQKKRYKCHKTFTKQSDLKRHSRVHTGEKPYKCTTYQKTFTRLSSLNVHKLTHTGEKPHECDVCHKTFTQRSSLKIHIRVHTGDKPYKCTTCQKTFTRLSSLNVHKLTHTGEKPHECDVCHKTFTQRCNLERHIRVHTGDKPYKCTECQKTCTQRIDLERHSRVHTGEKPYKCTICQKTFSRLSNFNAHKLTHTNEKPHECNVCHKKFKSKSNLLIHKRIHNNMRSYKCAVCNKAFAKSSKLTRHMLTHTGEKPHQCHLCEYKCADAGHLKTHIRRHTGEKPYTCKHCEKPFTTTSELKKHERSIHSNEELN